MLKCQTKMSNETHNLCVFLSACLQDISQDVSQLLLYLTDVWLSLYDFSLCSTLSWKWLSVNVCLWLQAVFISWLKVVDFEGQPSWFQAVFISWLMVVDFGGCLLVWSRVMFIWWLILKGVSLYNFRARSSPGIMMVADFEGHLCTISGHVHLLVDLKGISLYDFRVCSTPDWFWWVSVFMISGCIQLLTDFDGCLSLWFQCVFNSWLILMGVCLYDFRVCSTPDWF